MLHQTLLSFQPFSPSSLRNSLPSPSPSALLLSPQVEMKLSASDQAFLAFEETEDLAWASDRTNLLCEDFHVEDLLDLRALSEFEENEEPLRITEPSFSPPKSLPCAENNPLELYSEITAQDNDAASLEWLSRFFDDISKEFPSSPPLLPNQNPQPKYHSPGSRDPARVKAKRSKRLRGSSAVWSRSSSLKLRDCSSASSITSLTTASPTRSSSSSSSSFNSYISFEPYLKPKKRGRKPKNSFFSQAERRCTHCGVHKTPQWRAGPEGAKTLCNACGVRYKSGRLLPEYRPACSPTFVGSIHSNSHRKVLEMRRKNDEQQSAHAVTSC